MITQFNMHRITGIRLESIDSGSAMGHDYYSRGIVFESLRHDGTTTRHNAGNTISG